MTLLDLPSGTDFFRIRENSGYLEFELIGTTGGVSVDCRPVYSIYHKIKIPVFEVSLLFTEADKISCLKAIFSGLLSAMIAERETIKRDAAENPARFKTINL